ncbi:WXG100 family type VII secretion target [Streptoalloteichus hindustanus]|uniref:ESAT-6-like protein n=1 Tax=Streptoalloteichus hindustanus TaxID=2017 RepID=A0A1M5PVV5_STRHI|nr:WXG100 family type VII secretion target [Streptoalloteichus hindustanus]SHH06005.1 WXG100 family type VII secretion target [Streptoalloteichus hindustanus]
MAPQPTSVSTPAMRKAAGEFEAALSTSRTTSNTMQTTIAQLGTSWRGEAAARFVGSLNAWSGEYQNIIRQLETMLRALHGNARNYTVTEDSALERAATAMRGLPGL